jgi:hypothetical protein
MQLRWPNAIWRDIRFWIFLFFLIRLIGITHPPIEVGHNWRQTTVTMVARNFYEVDAHPYYPRVDFGSAAGSISAMEFPLLNHLMYQVSCVFGYAHWYGRLINLLITSIGLFYFYRLLKILFEEPLAFASTLLLTTSIWFQFGRKIMPDTFAVSLLLIAFYHIIVFLTSTTFQWWRLLTASILFMCGAMSKLPAVIPFFALPLLYFKWPDKKRWMALTLIFTLASIPVMHWYFIWTDHLTSSYGMHHFFMGKNMATGAKEISNQLGLTLHRIFIGPLKYSGCAAFIIGIGYAVIRKNKPLLYLLLFTGIALLLILLKSGETFYAHDYYIIPFVPIVTIFVAFALMQFPNRWAGLALMLICVESVLNQTHDLRWKKQYDAFVQLESVMDQHTNPNDCIAVNCAPNPSTLYFAHRKGWICTNEELQDEAQLETMRKMGVKFVLICKSRFGQNMEMPTYKMIFENQQFKLFAIEKTESSFGIADYSNTSITAY